MHGEHDYHIVYTRFKFNVLYNAINDTVFSVISTPYTAISLIRRPTAFRSCPEDGATSYLRRQPVSEARDIVMSSSVRKSVRPSVCICNNFGDPCSSITLVEFLLVSFCDTTLGVGTDNNRLCLCVSPVSVLHYCYTATDAENRDLCTTFSVFF